MILAHQGGRDEILLAAVPIACIAVLVLAARRTVGRHDDPGR